MNIGMVSGPDKDSRRPFPWLLNNCSYEQYNASMDTPASSLDHLLHRADVWRARDGQRCSGEAVLPSGWPELDQALHLGGWPAQGLTEWLLDGSCPQALRLLLPALSGADDGLVVLAGAPARPHTRTLRRAGLDPEQLLLLRARDPDTLMRACRECAASDTAATLVAWLPRRLHEPRNLQKLHRAARLGRCLLVLMRDIRDTEQPSPAPLRLVLGSRPPGDLAVRIEKQPGGWAGQELRLAVLPQHLRYPPEAPAHTAPALEPDPEPVPRAQPPLPAMSGPLEPGEELPG